MDSLPVGIVSSLIAVFLAGWVWPRAQLLFQRWGNNSRTVSLAQLDKEEAETRKLHDDSAELLRYGLYHFSDVLWGVFVAVVADLMLLGNAAAIPSDSLTFGINIAMFSRVAAFLGSLLMLAAIVFRLTKVSQTLSNVYRFDKWTEYVAKRRAKLTSKSIP